MTQHNRPEAESIISALTGGDQPSEDETILFRDGVGWVFDSFSSSITSATAIINHGWGIRASITDSIPFFYWIDIEPPSDTESVKVTYDPGAGSFSYTYDMTTRERIVLQEEDDPLLETLKDFTTNDSQASFIITVEIYDAIEGGGTLLGTVVLITGEPARGGRGTALVASDTTLIRGNAIYLTAPFEAFPSYDNADPPNELGEPTLGLRGTYNAGNQATNWAPDYENGATQKCTLTGNLQVDAPLNLPDGATMNIYFTLGGYELTFASADYEGLNLSFTTEAQVTVSLVNFNEAKTIVATMGY